MKRSAVLAISSVVGAVFTTGVIVAYTNTSSESVGPVPWAPVQGEQAGSSAFGGHAADRQSAVDDETLSDILSRTSATSRLFGLYTLLESYDADELDRVLTEVDKLGPVSVQNRVRTAVFERYAEVDPNRALAIQASDYNLSYWHLRTVFGSWARNDFDAALRSAEAMVGWEKTWAVSAVLTARDDLPSSLRKETAKRNGLEISTASSASMAARTWDELESLWVQADVSDGRDDAYFAAWELSRRDPERALPLILTKENLGADSERMLTRRIVSDYPIDRLASALDAVIKYGQSDSQLDAISRLFNRWSNHSPSDALNAAEQLPTRRTRDTALRNVFEQWLKIDPQFVVDRHRTVPRDNRSRILGRAIGQLDIDPVERLEVARNTLGLSEVAGAVSMIFHESPMEDIGSIQGWIEENAPTAMAREIMVSVLYQYSKENLEGALEVAEDLPSHSRRRSPVESIMRQAMRRPGGVEKAQELVPRIRDDKVRSRVYQQIGETLAWRDLDASIDYAQNVPDKDRGSYYNSVLNLAVNNVEHLKIPLHKYLHLVSSEKVRSRIERHLESSADVKFHPESFLQD